jgi:diguanylate cyclase (GGDEF)-like protein
MSKPVRGEPYSLNTQTGEGIEASTIEQVVVIIAGLLLVGRAIAFTPSPIYAVPLRLVRIAFAIVLSVWGCLSLISATRPSPSRRIAWGLGNTQFVLLFVWSVSASVADIFAGTGPAVFVACIAYATVFGWNRIRLFIAFVLAGVAVLSLAIFVSSRLGIRPDVFRMEDLFVVSATAVATILAVKRVRSSLMLRLEKLRSLESENKQLWDLSFKDSLTGLYNRRFAQETGRVLVSRVQRYHEQLHVLMLDIDHFKKVNDELSHAVGDEVLKGVAQSIQACLRISDYVARYGGEEFLVFLVQAEAEDAQFIANRIRELVASQVFSDVPWKVTISIGVASIKGDDDFETLVDRADKYLYSSKRGGRNRVSGF